MAYLGLDIGTTGCKASLIHKNGSIVYSASKEYDLLFPGDGRIEISPETIWNAVREVLTRTGRESKERVDSVSIASFGESFVLLDENDVPVADSIFYTDARGTEEIRDITSAIPEEKLFQITGMPVNSMYSLNKLIWIKKYQPERMERAKKLLLYGDFIGYKLTGRRSIDYSLASRTMMLDIQSKTWSEEIFSAFQLDSRMFSTPQQAGTVTGIISPVLCDEFGFKNGTTLVLGGHDQACAALGCGAVMAGDSCDSFGSAECITVVIQKEQISGEMKRNNYCCEPHLLSERFITLAFNSSAGASLKWYRNNLEKERYQEQTSKGGNIYKLLDEECPKKPSSVLFLPYMSGSGTPDMDAFACGAFSGITIGTSKNELYKAVMEGICFDMKHNMERLELIGIDTKTVQAVGGGARSETLLQIKSDIFGIPVNTLTVSEAGTMGLAILSAVACKDYPDYESAIDSMVKVKKTYVPIPDNTKIYEMKYKQFKKMRSAIRQISQTED